MGSSSGSSYFPELDKKSKCSELHFFTILIDVNVNLLNSVKEGVLLTVRYNDNKKSVEVAYKSKKLGIISHVKTVELIDCILKGNNYIAIVKKKLKDNCELSIEFAT